MVRMSFENVIESKINELVSELKQTYVTQKASYCLVAENVPSGVLAT